MVEKNKRQHLQNWLTLLSDMSDNAFGWSLIDFDKPPFINVSPKFKPPMLVALLAVTEMTLVGEVASIMYCRWADGLIGLRMFSFLPKSFKI